MTKHNYCMECAALILQKAREELTQLTFELKNSDQLSRRPSG